MPGAALDIGGIVMDEIESLLSRASILMGNIGKYLACRFCAKSNKEATRIGSSRVK